MYNQAYQINYRKMVSRKVINIAPGLNSFHPVFGSQIKIQKYANGESGANNKNESKLCYHMTSYINIYKTANMVKMI